MTVVPETVAPDIWIALALIAGGYLLGSVPFGVVVAKALGSVDPRTAGSRNIGFTNVLRVGGKVAGSLTLLGDLGKGLLVGVVAQVVLEEEGWILLAAASPILGHVFPIFLQFRGGKGVATALGAVFGVAPLVGVILTFVWVAVVALWRYSSGGAIAAFGLFPVVAAVLWSGWKFEIFACGVGGLVLVRHKDNLIRIWNRTEPKIGASKAPLIS